MKRRNAVRRSMRGVPQKHTSGFGQAILESLRGWEAGEPLTIRHVAEIQRPRAFSAEQIRELRLQQLRVSQAVFAHLLGVSVKLVEAWEAGRNRPAAPVLRLFEMISRDPQAFLRRYIKGAA